MYGIEGLLAGRTLVDRYRIDEVIGRGGMGAVYRARDTRLGRDVAVKVITVAAPDAEMHERLRARFHREARAAAALHHPNVVAVYDFGTDPVLGLDFLVMELLRGEDLSSHVTRKGPPAPSTALSILYQAACGLAAGHRAGLIHRDVKPGNLFVEPGDRTGDVHVKVLDFGIAELTTSDEATITHLTVAGRSPFSPAFASPEQLRAEGRLSPATDVFSLGAVGFQLLTGRRAFNSPDPRQVVVEVSQALASLAGVPGLAPAVRDVLRRALAPHPEDRFPHAGAMADALAAVLSGRELSAEEVERASRPVVHHDHAAEGTRAFTELEPQPARRRGTEPPFRTAPPPTVAPEVGELLQRDARRAAPPASATPAPLERRPSWVRRAARAVWEFLVTAGAVGAFAAAWVAVVFGLQDRNLTNTYLAAAASVFLTPFALHRLMSRRGSLRLALSASILGSIAVVLLLGRGQDEEVVLAAMFLAQVGLSLLAERLTQGSDDDFGSLTDPHRTPGQA